MLNTLNKEKNISLVFIVVSVFILSVLLSSNKLVGASSPTTTTAAGNGTLREWLTSLRDEANALESSSLKLQKAIAVLSSANNTATIINMRLAQLKKINQALELVKQEMLIINSTCLTNDGPDCSIPICNSKCLNCSLPGKCSTCTGNFDGLDCSSCKPGWKDINCSLPICDSKCLNCTAPNQCAVCSGLWTNPSCSSCKTGWSGSNCSTPICDSKCTNCVSPGNCTQCSGNWQGVNCSTCKSGWSNNDCNTPVCDSKCVTCASPSNCSVCTTGWTGANCTAPVCDSKCSVCSSPGVCVVCNGNWQGSTCSTCKVGFSGSTCSTEIAIDVTSTNLLTSSQITRFKNEIINGVMNGPLKLLYKASRDTFSSDIFHAKCDGKGPTVTIIKATNGAVFGGYTSVSWNSYATGVQVKDTAAFLFSLVSPTNQERFTKLIQENGYYYKSIKKDYLNSVYHSSGYGPAFGGGMDLFIKNGNNCYSDLCYSYCDTTMVHASQGPATAQSYLGGSYTFLLDDYEVYSLA